MEEPIFPRKLAVQPIERSLFASKLDAESMEDTSVKATKPQKEQGTLRSQDIPDDVECQLFAKCIMVLQSLGLLKTCTVG